MRPLPQAFQDCEVDVAQNGVIRGIYARIAISPEGRQFPQRICRLLVDTGSMVTRICADVAEELELPVVGSANVIGQDGRSERHDRHRISAAIHFDSGGFHVVHMGAVSTERDRRSDRGDGILGLDFLSDFFLAYDGPAGECRIVARREFV